VGARRLERALAEHPTVRECAVLAVEDENRLMTLKAYVALRPGHAGDAATTKALQDFVKRTLVPFKYPRASISMSCRRPARTRSIGSGFGQWVEGDAQSEAAHAAPAEGGQSS
jgi:acyl-CoA synthetase (AMP-forming)/AMP-acid ligase II